MVALGIKLALSPLLVTQALYARSRLPRLPEADGPREGTVGQGELLTVLVTGDSSAAGVGVATQREALALPLARRLAALTKRRVQWTLLAQSGLTTAQAHERLARELPRAFDIAVVVTGVNDVVDQVPSHRAVAAREALANRLRNGHGVHHVVFAPLPPVHRFPGLPQPLRWVAGADARRHNAAMCEWTATRADVSCVPMAVELDAANMAPDGFHPGEPVYRYCAGAIATHVAELLRPFSSSVRVHP